MFPSRYRRPALLPYAILVPIMCTWLREYDMNVTVILVHFDCLRTLVFGACWITVSPLSTLVISVSVCLDWTPPIIVTIFGATVEGLSTIYEGEHTRFFFIIGQTRTCNKNQGRQGFYLLSKIMPKYVCFKRCQRLSRAQFCRMARKWKEIFPVHFVDMFLVEIGITKEVLQQAFFRELFWRMGEAQTSGTLSFSRIPWVFFKNSLSFSRIPWVFQEFLDFHRFLPISNCFYNSYLPFLYGNHVF